MAPLAIAAIAVPVALVAYLGRVAYNIANEMAIGMHPESTPEKAGDRVALDRLARRRRCADCLALVYVPLGKSVCPSCGVVPFKERGR